MSSSPEESPLPPEVRARIEADPWPRALGIRFLALGRGVCRLALTIQPHMVKQGRRAGFYEVSVTSEEGALVAQVHCVAHTVPTVE